MDNQRYYTVIDQFCLNVDQALRNIFKTPVTTGREYPALHEPEPTLSLAQKKYSSSLMRVNHAGEVCAQALYHGQGLTSRDPMVQEKMSQAANEEGDHLAWCDKRLQELGSHTSYLNPIWYFGSFGIGVVAGICGDKWSLGFLKETEHQVVMHLDEHLKKIPVSDRKSLKILKQMQLDEAQHRDDAMKLGAAELPSVVKKLMRLTSKVMVKIAFWI